MGDKHQNTPPPPKPRRTIISVIQDVFLERYPEAKPVREYLGEKMPGVKLKRWVVFCLLTIGLAALGSYLVHRADKSSFDSKVTSTNAFYAGELAKKESDISNLEGQLFDAKSERDKNQMLLAPFQAAALKIYTNEPLEQRLDLLVGKLGEMSILANIELWINDNTNLIQTEAILHSRVAVSNYITLNDRKIHFKIFNYSKYPARNCYVAILAYIDPTNVVANGWEQEIQNLEGQHSWHCNANLSVPQFADWAASNIEISTNFADRVFIAQIDIGADNAENKTYFVNFSFK